MNLMSQDIIKKVVAWWAWNLKKGVKGIGCWPAPKNIARVSTHTVRMLLPRGSENLKFWGCDPVHPLPFQESSGLRITAQTGSECLLLKLFFCCTPRANSLLFFVVIWLLYDCAVGPKMYPLLPGCAKECSYYFSCNWSQYSHKLLFPEVEWVKGWN